MLRPDLNPDLDMPKTMKTTPNAQAYEKQYYEAPVPRHASVNATRKSKLGRLFPHAFVVTFSHHLAWTEEKRPAIRT